MVRQGASGLGPLHALQSCVSAHPEKLAIFATNIRRTTALTSRCNGCKAAGRPAIAEKNES